jgi:hypothetical protein
MTWDALFGDGLGMEPLDAQCLDRQPPRPLVHALAMRTGVKPERIWSMTLSGYVPWIIDTLDTADATCLSTYATQYQTLLTRQTPWVSKGRYDPKTGRYCLPWLSEPGSSEQTLCLACLRTDPIPHHRLFWRLALMGSCPLHGCLLTTLPGAALSMIPDIEAPLESADRDLLSVDELSLQAVTHGRVRFPNGSEMDAAVYVRFLRSLIEELFCRRGAAGTCAETLAAVWKAVGCRPYAGLTVSKPFERLTLEQQRDTLRVVGRLLSDLPDSLQQHMPLTSWERRHYQRLPSAVHQMCRPSEVIYRGAPPSIRMKPLSPSQIVAAIEELAQSDEGAEQLIRFITAYCRWQTSEELWQLIYDIRAASASHPPR